MSIKNIKSLITLLTILVVFNSCKKEYETIENIDEAKIQAYIKQNSIPAIKDPSGYYYQVLDQGTGGELLNKDSVFYNLAVKSLTGTSYYTPLEYSNEGNYLGYLKPDAYRTAMLAVKRGGKVRVIVPSYLAYGKNGLGVIPPNEVLVTEITVYPETKQWEIDDKVIKQFIAAKGLTMTKHSSRVYLNISTAGSGEVVKANSLLKVKYKGRLLTGTVFDENSTGIDDVLSGFVQGWRKGLLGLTKGTKLRMIIPSDLAYGPAGTTGIPPNAPLDFDIELVEVTN
jgi:FKBP-type peptidyl-prolyl cis-trans isomerase FkpA